MAAKIFISYRREDSAATCGRIYDRLVAPFGRAEVFKDVDSIPPGVDFRSYINLVMEQCAVQLTIIGPHWLSAADAAGNPRLENPGDFVRLEVESALQRGIPVIPILVQGATPPAESQLPASLQDLAYRNALQVRYDPDFDGDMQRIITAIHRIIDTTTPEPKVEASPLPTGVISDSATSSNAAAIPSVDAVSSVETPSVSSPRMSPVSLAKKLFSGQWTWAILIGFLVGIGMSILLGVINEFTFIKLHDSPFGWTIGYFLTISSVPLSLPNVLITLTFFVCSMLLAGYTIGLRIRKTRLAIISATMSGVVELFIGVLFIIISDIIFQRVIYYHNPISFWFQSMTYRPLGLGVLVSIVIVLGAFSGWLSIKLPVPAAWRRRGTDKQALKPLN